MQETHVWYHVRVNDLVSPASVGQHQRYTYRMNLAFKRHLRFPESFFRTPKYSVSIEEIPVLQRVRLKKFRYCCELFRRYLKLFSHDRQAPGPQKPQLFHT